MSTSVKILSPIMTYFRVWDSEKARMSHVLRETLKFQHRIKLLLSTLETEAPVDFNETLSKQLKDRYDLRQNGRTNSSVKVLLLEKIIFLHHLFIQMYAHGTKWVISINRPLSHLLTAFSAKPKSGAQLNWS